MKISEMTNDQATEAMIRLSGPFSAICDDDDFIAFWEKAKKKGAGVEGKPMLYQLRALAALIPDFVLLGLKKHKQDLYEIVGALLMVPTGRVGGMNVVETIKAIRDSYDDILASFFTRSGASTNGGASESV